VDNGGFSGASGPRWTIKPKVIFETDTHNIEQVFRGHTLQFLLASSLEKYLCTEG